LVAEISLGKHYDQIITKIAHIVTHSQLSCSSTPNSLTNIRTKFALSVSVSKRIYPQLVLNRKTFSTHLSLLLKPPSVDLSLSSFAKAETIPEVFKSKFLEICDGPRCFCQIYTDGSKTNNGTAAAAVSGDVVKSLRITSHASIFTAELVALNLVLDIIRRSCLKKFVIFSDSLSGLLAIRNNILSVRNCICTEIHHKPLSTGQCRKLYYPDLNTRSYWYPR